MRFVFRRSGSLIGLYVGLVFAYGSLSYFNAHLGIETVKRILTGVVTASTLLHFYYDGFIWKVRERSTRQSLGLAGGTADPAPAGLGGILPSWAWHGLKWVAVFVVPLSALWFWQTHLNVPEVQRRAWLVQDVPVGARQHFDYGLALQKEGQWERAEEQYKIALSYKPTDAKSHMNLATVLMAQAKYDAAAPHMEEALRLQPDNGEFHFGYTSLLQRLGRGEEAGPHYEAAARLMPDSPEAHYNYALFLASTGKGNDALSELRRVVQLKPDYVDARLQLADGLFAKGDLEEAKTHYTTALRADPKLAVAHNSLGRLYLTQGQISQAIVQFGEALRLNPGYKEAEENLRIAKASDAQFLQQTHN
jgi:Tfp pilus assembly protein PilF